MKRSLQIRPSRAVIATVVLLILGAVAGFGFGVMTVQAQGPSHGVPVYVAQNSNADSSATSGQPGFAAILKPALPAVVSITSSRIVNVPQSPIFNDPFFRHFFGQQGMRLPQQQRETGLGSGVIISPDGYILTNNHVIEKATNIKVLLADRREFPGKVIGTDPKTDIAVVKIDVTGLPTITLGDSSKLQVGDYAFAIGNPFGVGETATMGIISATGRNGLDIEDYEDFIQTDAAINPGNSGGALLDASGQVIGINTAILSGGSGGNQGIGFAIPINMAKYVMDQIIKHGKVVRGFIGIGIQEVTPDLAKLFKVPPEKGALVSSISANSPAEKAGLQRGDVIEELNGQQVHGPNDLRLKVGAMAPGTTVHLKVNNSGKTRDVTLKLGEAPSEKGPQSRGESPAENSPMRGVQVDELTANIRNQLGLSANTKGVVVTDVADGSPAQEAGLKRGDVIEQIDRQAVNSVTEYNRLVRKAGKETVVLLINRQGETTFIVVQPE